MSTFTDPLGIMKTGFPLRSKDFYDVENGWELILPGEEIRRSKDLKRVAITRAEIEFNSEENLYKFLEVIRESDSRLSKIPDDEVLYDWQNVFRKELTIRFGVAWYDKNYYQQKKDTWRESMHSRILSNFGVSPETLRIEHIPL